MTDMHVHLERGPYAIEWLNRECRIRLSEYTDFITEMRKQDFPVDIKYGLEKAKDAWRKKNVDEVYKRYYQLMIRLSESGLFPIPAHPDSLKCFGYLPDEDLSGQYEQLARLLKKNGVKAEMNCGLHNKYGIAEIGLNEKLLRVFQEHGVELITASDAHRPEDAGRGITEAVRLLERRGYW